MTASPEEAAGPKVRLQRFLAECGLGSRRQCEAIIAQGRVRVNEGEGALGQLVSPGIDRVEVDGTPVQQDALVYLLLNKPAGVVTSARDDDDRETVSDLVRQVPQRVFPIGRLDMEAEGALLLTNDGALAHALTQPGRTLERVYIATVRGLVHDATAARLASGILLEDGATVHARVRVLHTAVDTTVLRIALHEGPSVRVRHLCAVVGHPVVTLRRIVEASIALDDLAPSQVRPLGPDEIARLRTEAGLPAARLEPAQ